MLKVQLVFDLEVMSYKQHTLTATKVRQLEEMAQFDLKMVYKQTTDGFLQGKIFL